MIGLSIKYTDYDGTQREEKFYFHLSYADLIRLELTDKDGFKQRIQKMIDTEDQQEIWKTLESIVQMSVGKKSMDGRRFDRSYEAKADFLESEAYSSFIRSMVEDANYAAEFVNGLIATSDNKPAGNSIPAPAIDVVK